MKLSGLAGLTSVVCSGSDLASLCTVEDLMCKASARGSRMRINGIWTRLATPSMSKVKRA